MYNLIIRPKAEKFLNRILSDDFEKISKAILELAENPRPFGVENLVQNIYRIRAGNYRIIYLIDEKNKAIEIGKVDRRRESTYKFIKKLFRKF